jgi:CubicO group peptidase (beta-lactamase class C family)
MRALSAFFVFAAASLAGPASALAPAHELTRADAASWLQGFFPYALAQGDIAGAAVVIVKDGEVIALRGYGLADVERGTPVDPERTLFRTGSVGKLFTWTAVMQQVEAGRLALDRDVNEYLDFRIPARDGKPVTLRNLMTHTPGFEEAVKRLVADRTDRLATAEAYLKAWTPERIYPPGEIPAYSNYGVTLAGYMLERVSGERYDDYVERHVFAPLRMARSTTRQVLPARFEAAMSRGYGRGSGPAMPFERFGVGPAGGATTTAADMARFMCAWLQGGEFGGARLLRDDTVRLALGTKLRIVPPLNGMLLGFFEQDVNGRRVVGHRGESQFFHSTLNLFADDGVGVYAVVNSSGRDGAAVPLLTEFVNAFADRYFPAAEAPGSVADGEAALRARRMAGTWVPSRGQTSNFFSLLGFLSQVKVSVDDTGALSVPALTGANGRPMRWRETAPYVWQQVGGKERLAARVENGRVAMWSVDSVSPFLVMLPAPWWKSSAIFAPLLAVALVAVATAFLSWPVNALLRRHYRLWPANAGPDGRCWRFARIAAGLVLAALVAWAVLIAQVDGNLFAYSPELDPWIVLLKVATAVACGGGTALAGLDAARNWAIRGGAARAASILLALAFVTLLWIALALRLAGYSSDY